jgi:hypothetical protein
MHAYTERHRAKRRQKLPKLAINSEDLRRLDRPVAAAQN